MDKTGIKIDKMGIFHIIIALLTFYAVLPYWKALSDDSSFDIMRPVAYGFAALAGFLYLIKLFRKQGQKPAHRRLYLASAIILIAAPFLFFAMGKFLGIYVRLYFLWALNWLAGIFTLVSLSLTLRARDLNKLEKTALVASLVIALIAPFMPWWQLILGREITLGGSLGNVVYLWMAQYGVWVVAVVWGFTAVLMVREKMERIKARQTEIVSKGQAQMMHTGTVGFVLGLGLFLAGMYNQVSYSSDVYEQRTYIGGRLVGTDIVNLATLNAPLLIGMGLILFTLLIMLFFRFNEE